MKHLDRTLKVRKKVIVLQNIKETLSMLIEDGVVNLVLDYDDRFWLTKFLSFSKIETRAYLMARGFSVTVDTDYDSEGYEFTYLSVTKN